VAKQWTPPAKRFAKLNVDAAGAVGHTGKDMHPEAKRLATLCFWKLEKDVVEFFGSWPADADRPEDRLFGGPLEELDPAGVEYSPDDSTPWAWDLGSELFAQVLG
jgi:hypothetical protein